MNIFNKYYIIITIFDMLTIFVLLHQKFVHIRIIQNKAIRYGKYLARHMPVLGNVHPIKIENVDIFFVTSFLCSLELLYY